MPVEKVRDKRYGEVTKYKCDFCRTEYTNQRELGTYKIRTYCIQITLFR
jgi:hypothetical protein